jgi:DNA polymerase-3 subunit alpha
MGQFSLCAGDPETTAHHTVAVPTDEWSPKIKLAFEKEMLGLYISDHPLLGVATALRAAGAGDVPALWDLTDGAAVTLGGLVTGITRRFTKKGDPMLFFTLEDLQGGVEVVCFPRVVAEFGPLVTEDAVLIVSGRLDHRGDDVKVMARELKELVVRSDGTVRLEVSARRLSADLVQRLKGVLANHPGQAPVFLHMTNEKGHKVLKLADEFRVEPRSALYAELRELLGPRAVL